MTTKISLTDTGSFKLRRGGWYFTAKIGPFDSHKDAYEFVSKIAALELQPKSPPPLGINISDTINTTDKFG